MGRMLPFPFLLHGYVSARRLAVRNNKTPGLCLHCGSMDVQSA